MPDDDAGMDAARAGMESVGYHYARRSGWPDAWQATVAEAASAFDAAILGEKQKLLERINTNRLQLKFPRTLAALPAPIRACVEEIEARVRALCGDEAAGLVLQDCYALLTPADETDEEARSPQRARAREAAPAIAHGGARERGEDRQEDGKIIKARGGGRGTEDMHLQAAADGSWVAGA